MYLYCMSFLSCSMCNVLFVASFCMLNVLLDTVDTMWNVVTHEKLILIAKSQTLAYSGKNSHAQF